MPYATDTVSGRENHFTRNDFIIIAAGFILFLLIVVFPCLSGYFSYTSDTRHTYENQGFILLDAIHGGELPLWDPYNANGRDTTCITVGVGAFAPDLVAGSWLIDKIFPNLKVIDKSIIVNFIFRYFFIFGAGLWLLGRLIFKTQAALYYFWFILMFGTPIVFLLNNQILGQAFNYYPLVLFFLLAFVRKADLFNFSGLLASLSLAFLNISRDTPVLFFVIFITFIVVAIVFWEDLISSKLLIFLKENRLALFLSALLFCIILVSLRQLASVMISNFHKLRFYGDTIKFVPLTYGVNLSNVIFGELLPDIKSILFPFPALTAYYGHYHAAHSYLFAGLAGIPLALVALMNRAYNRKFIYTFVFLIALSFSLLYRAPASLYLFLHKIIPGMKFYQYPFHIKYFMLLFLIILAGIGLEALEVPAVRKRTWLLMLGSTLVIVVISTFFVIRFFLAVNFILLVFLMLIGSLRLCEAFLLSPKRKVNNGSMVLVSIEVCIAGIFILFGRPVFEAGTQAVRSDRMYFLGPRLTTFTMHACRQIPSALGVLLGGIYKCDLPKNELELWRMNDQVTAAQGLSEEQSAALFGPGAPRLFLASRVQVCPPDKLSVILSDPASPSITDVPVITGENSGNLPLYTRGERIISRDTLAGYRPVVETDIPLSNIRIRRLPARQGWLKLIISGVKFSRHLCTNPLIVEQERLVCFLNGKQLSPSWFFEDIGRVPVPAFELNKKMADSLVVIAPAAADEIKSLRLQYRNPQGIYIDGFGYNHLEATVRVPQKSVLVYLDGYARGWKATVDGKTAPVLKAYGAYKAVLVPAGVHKVRFIYRPYRIIFLWGAAYFSFFLLVVIFVIVARKNRIGLSVSGAR